MICAACHRSPNPVYVDLDLIQSTESRLAPSKHPVPNPPAARPALTATVLGLKAISLSDPSNRPKQTIHEMFLAGQAKAQADLLSRLKEVNKGAVREFQLQQESSITGDEARAYMDANVKIRPIFEKWANDRAPVLSDLALIEGFPIPDPQDKPESKPKTPVQQKQAETVTTLRVRLKSIDEKFKADSNAILAAVTQKTHLSKADLSAKVAHLAAELDVKAAGEANAQIRKAESLLSFKLADTAPINLPQSPSRHLTIPAEKALDPPPQVPSSGILDSAADRRRLLENELRIWLALNRFTLSATRSGHRDVTQEFQKWRQQHGAGP